MSRFGRLVALPVLVLMLLLIGAPPVTAQSGKFPVGAYESGPFTISFKEGGDFEVTHSNGGGVQGIYKVSGDKLELTDRSGDFVCPDYVGKYTWKVEGEKLVMTVVDDPCEGRAQALSMPLAKKSAK